MPTMTRRNHRRLLVAAIVLGVILVVAVTVLVRGLRDNNEPTPRPAIGEAPPRQSAARFLDSVGVNVHVTYLDTSYGRIDEWLAPLRELGVRHVRDGLVLGNSANAAGLRALAAANVRLTLITSLDASADEQVRYATRTFGPAVDALEAPNEVDVMGPPDWAARMQRFLPSLRAAVDADGPPSHTIVGPSFVGLESWKQIGGVTGSWDVTNLHPYPGGHEPSSNVDQQLTLARQQRRGRPIQATETGYHNALRASSGQPPVSEQAVAAYLPRLALGYFAAGIERTFIYELADEKPDPGLGQPEQHFGLLRHLLQTVRRSSGSGVQRDVRVSAPNDVHKLLLQRGDGSSVLALWRSAPVWSAEKRAPSAVRPVQAIVHFGDRAEDVQVSRPSLGPDPVQRRADAKDLRVPVAGDAVLVSYR
jgi:hypothetical protein